MINGGLIGDLSQCAKKTNLECLVSTSQDLINPAGINVAKNAQQGGLLLETSQFQTGSRNGKPIFNQGVPTYYQQVPTDLTS